MRKIVYGGAISIFAIVETMLSRSIAENSLLDLYRESLNEYGETFTDLLYYAFAGIYVSVTGPLLVWLLCVIIGAFLKMPSLKWIGVATILGSIGWSIIVALKLFRTHREIDYTVILPVLLAAFIVSLKQMT